MQSCVRLSRSIEIAIIVRIISVWPIPNSGIECVDVIAVIAVNVDAVDDAVDDMVDGNTAVVVEVECVSV